jgi:hypothetical protein
MEGVQKTTISVMTGVTEVTVPSIMIGRGHGECTGHWVLERVKLPRTIATKKVTPGKVLHRKTKRVKIDKTIITNSKLMNKDKIYNYVRCNKDIAKMKWAIIR